MLGWHEDGDNLDHLKAYEAQLGKRFAIVRMYNQWHSPSRKVDQMVAEDRLVLSSHKPPPPGAGGWAAVASHREDETITALARKYRSYGRQVVFIFHHEPHDDASDIKGGDYGSSSEFKAAWRRVHAIFVREGAHVSNGGNVLFGYSATGNRALPDSDGRPDPLYPGDRYVDLFAHDRYNWAACRGERWESFAENWNPLVELAERHGKPLIPAEFGAPPAGGKRNSWFEDAARWMKTDPRARRWLIGFAYYHSFHDSCHWDFMRQANDGRSGWTTGFSADRYFVERPFSLGAESMTSASGSSEAAGPPHAAPLGRPSRATWSEGSRHEDGIPAGYGEVSGFAASQRYPGWAWAIRDSGNEASLFGLRSNGALGRFSLKEFPVKGASNRDWEDVVYASDGAESFLYVVDNGAKTIYKIKEPDPEGSAGAVLVARYRYAFPDGSPSGTCGPRDNTEAAFLYPVLGGRLHLVRKMKSPALVYRFESLSPSRLNVPVRVGSLGEASCISVAAVSSDNRFIVTASHDILRIREGTGTLSSLLHGSFRHASDISPDNNEAGDFFPWGSRDLVIGAENRSTRHLRGG